MHWKNFLSRLTGRAAATFKLDRLDYRLLRRTQPRRFPRWSQFKYLPRFLSTPEKRTVLLAGFIVLATTGVWLGSFLKSRLIAIPRSGGEYSEAFVGQPQFINPLFATTSDIDADLTALIYSGLFYYNKDGQLAPRLAKGYTISEDKKTYTVTLRDDVRWSDGESFTAADVVFTFELIQNQEVGSPLRASFERLKVASDGDYTVRFGLEEPFAPFLHTLTVGILPEHVWGNVASGNIKLANTNLQPIGTGPWQFAKLIKDEAGTVKSYVLEKNERYFGKKPHLKTITFKFYTDYAEALEAVRSQEVKAISFAPRLPSKGLAESKQTATYRLKLPQYTALFFNESGLSELKNNDVRKALALGIDKNALISEALQGNGQVIDAPILENTLGHYPDLKPIPFDAEQANTLLDKQWSRLQPEDYFKLRSAELIKNRNKEIDELKKASSTPERMAEEEQKIKPEVAGAVRAEMRPEQTFYRKNKEGKLFRITITTVDNPEYLATAESIKKMWAKAGIATDIYTVPSRQLIREVLKEHDYQVLLYGTIVGGDPDPFPFWHSSQIDYPGVNLARYANRNADKILEEARVTVDETKRAELYKKFQELLARDLPAIFLYTPYHSFIVNKDIKGVGVGNITNPSDRHIGMEEWYVKTKWRWK